MQTNSHSQMSRKGIFWHIHEEFHRIVDYWIFSCENSNQWWQIIGGCKLVFGFHGCWINKTTSFWFGRTFCYFFMAQLLLLHVDFIRILPPRPPPLSSLLNEPRQPAAGVDQPPYLFFYRSHVWSHEYLWDLVSVEPPLQSRYLKRQVCGLVSWMNPLVCAFRGLHCFKK